MSHYIPPLEDMAFVLNEVLDAPATLAALPAHTDIDADLIQQVLEEAGRFASTILAPLNASGDKAGCRFNDGAVVTPAGFADAYGQFVEAGWPALACTPAFGGQGLPATLHIAISEMLSASNHAWSMYPGLLHGAYACLQQHASEALKQAYLPRITSGEWLATMCLTEAGAGSDLGLIRTRAIAGDHNDYRITGSKIFISGGEHDLTDNIIHLVLARLPDAPAGSRGLSLFLVPKILPDNSRNHVHCTGIEEKMGLHGSATCSMHFDAATGWLVGLPNQGLQAMFVMMNAARLHVGTQGLGLAEAAYQKSLAYAHERQQSRVPGPRTGNPPPADPIALQPAVHRLLMNQRSIVEGGRMLAYWAGVMLDSAECHADTATRATMHQQLELVTPIIKAYLTSQGFLGTNDAIQVFGGHGYITETGIEQYMRDIRVTMLYEGTNEIQATDFMLRKVIADKGQVLASLLEMIEDTAHMAHGSGNTSHANALLDASRALRAHVADLRLAMASAPLLPYQLAPEMLRMTGHILLAWLWLRAASAAKKGMPHNPDFYRGKCEAACYYFNYIFPEVQGLSATVKTVLDQKRHESALSCHTDLMTTDAR